jgi:hypothetical protein
MWGLKSMLNSSWYIKGLCAVIMLLCSYAGAGQVLPIGSDPTDTLPGDPAAMVVYKTQNLNFGAFVAGTGGSITINTDGSKSVTGGVLALNTMPTYTSIFEISTPIGSTISFAGWPATLTNGAASMTLTLIDPFPGGLLITSAQPPARTIVNVGGTLTVGTSAACPPGTYTGTFDVTFYRE